MNEKIHTVSSWLGPGSINLFGLPFAGKDTQCELLAEALGATIVGSGEILRAQEDNVELQQIMATGTLIPSDMYFNIILPYLQQEALRGKPLVLSSVGRMKGEEEIIVRAADVSEHPIRAVIFLTMPEEEVWQRHDAAEQLHDRGNRADDHGSRDVLQQRINKFNAETMPVIEFYRQQDLLIDIDGTGSREAIAEAIIDALFERATA